MPRGKVAPRAKTPSPKSPSPKKAAPRKRAAKKDDGRVKRPLSAYIIFTMERRPELLAQKKYKDYKIGELAKVMGDEWQKMDDNDRAPYNKKHESSVRKQRALGYEPGVKKAKPASGTLRVRRSCQEKMDMCLEHEAEVKAKRSAARKTKSPRKSPAKKSRGSPKKAAASPAAKAKKADKSVAAAADAAAAAAKEAEKAVKLARKAEKAAEKAEKDQRAATPKKAARKVKTPTKAKKSGRGRKQ